MPIRENSPQSSQLENSPSVSVVMEGELARMNRWFNLMRNPPEDFQQAWAKSVARIRERHQKNLSDSVQVEGPGR